MTIAPPVAGGQEPAGPRSAGEVPQKLETAAGGSTGWNEVSRVVDLNQRGRRLGQVGGPPGYGLVGGVAGHPVYPVDLAIWLYTWPGWLG